MKKYNLIKSVFLLISCVFLLHIPAFSGVKRIKYGPLVLVDTTEKAVKTAIVHLKDSVLSIREFSSGHDTARLGQKIIIKIQTEKPISTFNTLFINGLPVKKLKPYNYNDSEKKIYFNLERSDSSAETFLTLQSFQKKIIPITISVGPSASANIPASEENFYLKIYQKIGGYWVWVIAVILVWLVFIAFKNHVLKDDNNLYYSLGRSQLFYWTMIFMVSYLFIWYKTETLPDITASTLIILGISIGTTATGKIIENQGKEHVVIDPKAKSEGWLKDILSDGTSINIHRFQNVVFNLVFGIIFLQKVIDQYEMPDFDQNMLLLMGISSGTYAGLKSTEAQKEQKEPLPPIVGEDGGKKEETVEG